MPEVSLIRRIGSTFVGMVLGAVLIGLLQVLNHKLYPPPPGVDRSDPASIEAYMAVMPTEALVGVLVSYLLGTLGAGVLAAMMAKRDRGSIYATSALLMSMGLLNLTMQPHPAWFNILCPLTFVLAAVTAAKLTKRPTVEAK